MDEQRLLELLKEKIPYLEEVYRLVESVRKGSGHGEVFIGISSGEVDRLHVLHKKILKKRINNKLAVSTRE